MINITRKSIIMLILICVTVAFIPLTVVTVSAEAGETNPRIYIDGQKIETDVDPYIVNDRTLVPVALIVNYLGGTSAWDGPTQSVTLTYGEIVINLTIGSAVVQVNGIETVLDVAPELKVVKTGGDGARTMVPLRFVSESFGFKVGWDGDSTTVYIESANGGNSGTTTVRSVYLTANQIYAEQLYTYVTVSADRSLRDAMILEHSLKEPYRYYIDFNNTVFADTVSESLTQDVATSWVQGVRVKNNEDGTARLVVDLGTQQQPKVSFSDTGNEMTLSFLENRSGGDRYNPGPASSSQTWAEGDHDAVTVNETRKYDTLSAYAPFADGRLVVCIDPGHGASTGGKRSFDGSLLEWEFNRSVAYKLKGVLESSGVECVMTVSQYDKTDPSLADRTAVANSNKDIDLFVSIHANAYGSSWNSANGWEAYCYQLGGVSELAAKYITNSTLENIPELRDRGVKTAAFYVIKNTEMPAVLLEHGFYTNKTEVQYLKSDDFRNRLAQSDAAGIIKFFNHFR